MSNAYDDNDRKGAKQGTNDDAQQGGNTTDAGNDAASDGTPPETDPGPLPSDGEQV